MWTDPPMAILRRGDRVLVALGEGSGADDCAEVAAILTDSFPGVDFVVIDGADAVFLYTDDDAS